MPYVMVEKPQIPSQQPAPGDSVGPSRGSAPTSADVARQAGVSRATVSYVLNNTSAVRISEPTRRRVHEAAKELGYVPHAAARSLRAGHTRIVLMPAPDVPAGTLYSGFLNEFQWALSRFDYTAVQYGSVGVGGDDAARAWAELRPVAVLAPVGMGRRGIGILQRSGAKAVITLGAEPVEGAHALIADHRAVGRVAADHLRERGHRRIGVLMPREEGLDAFAAPRLAGIRQAGAEAVALPVSYDEESAAQVVARIRESGLGAVFAFNDEYAMLLMRALQDAGVGIPDDVSVVGADDLMLGRLLRPRLTTVRLALPSGQELAEFVDRLVRTPAAEPETRDVLGASLVRREST
ncbi:MULTISPECIES: LacI family DNA-binding transcriptional regulator [unclassified Streptomyces]|uniref:LacI family DNA-binding transcriptional regulator n=1 Tax=unclassified Streptomyces TaxID=2593676 RepID=UPI000DB971D4|nr:MULTISPECIES: LacI family DNA-binding transcriptional regulator [unclassified Streptomyces]MYT74826.1 substrate-binding domain-containing protein [Streptomyces sp. SID8367]